MKPHMQLPRGFTLIELVIVTVVIGIMAAALAPIALSSVRAYHATQGEVMVLDSLRYATERLVREIREVKYASSSAGTTCSVGITDRYCITMGGSNLTFTRSYYDAAGVPTQRDVTIIGAGGTVTLEYSDMPTTGAQVLTNDLTSLAFAYFDVDGHNAATTPAVVVTSANVRFVEIVLTLTPQNGLPYVQRTRVELRNR